MKRTLPIIVLGACAPSVPETPSYQQHVAPILDANCVRCHGIPVLGGAPAEFRLDAFNDYERPKRNTIGNETVSGAASYAVIVAARAGSSDAPMPPRFPLDDYQIETLQAWTEAGAPRGAPNAGNRAPTATVRGIQKALEEDGIGVRVTYVIDVDVRDPDPDVVGGALRARLGATELPLGLVRSGPNRIVWDTTNIARATFMIEALLDDGGAEISVPLGQIDVEGP